MEIKFSNEAADSVKETIKERLNTSVYGWFTIFWSLFHWQFLTALFFVSEEKIWEAHHILKTDYLNGLLWGNPWWWSAIFWLVPMFLTYFVVWKFHDWFLTDAFRMEEKYRTDKIIIKIREKVRVSEAEK